MKRTVKMWLAIGAITVSIAVLLAGCSAKPSQPSDVQSQVKKLEADKATLQAELDKLKGATKARQLRMQTFQPAGSVTAKAFEKYFGDVIREQTSGQLQIKLFPDNALVPEGELFEAVRKGVVDMAMTSPGRDAGKIGPAGDIILGLPFMWKTMDESRTLFYDLGIGEIARNLYGQHNIQVVGPAGSSGLDVSLITKTPVRTLDDLKGMKLRLSGGRAAGDLFTKFGATLVPSGMGAVYTNLGTGVITGASSDLTSAMAFGWHEVAKYVMQPPYITNYTVLLIANAEVWKSLTDSQRHLVEVAFANWNTRTYELARLESTQAEANLKAKGAQMVRLPESDVKKLISTAQEGWNKAAGNDPTAQKVLKIVKDFLKSKGYID